MFWLSVKQIDKNMALLLYLHFLVNEFSSTAIGLSLIYYAYIMRCIRLKLALWLIAMPLWWFRFIQKKKKKGVVTNQPKLIQLVDTLSDTQLVILQL